MSFNQRSFTIPQIIEKIRKYCAYQERSQFEVRQKLKSYKLSNDSIDDIIYDLIQDNFLNEQRFADAFVSGKFKFKKWGKIKLIAHLKQKKVSDYCISKAIQSIPDVDYQETICGLIDKKLNTLNSTSFLEKKSKVFNYLTQKGYSFTDINEVWNHLAKMDA